MDSTDAPSPTTYHRPQAHTHGQAHTCPFCLRQQKTTKKGYMVRHGWQEEGRRVGMYGLGVQHGRCPGAGLSPIEVTDYAARTFATAALKRAQELADLTTTRPAHLLQNLHLAALIRDPAELVGQAGPDAARALGVQLHTRKRPGKEDHYYGLQVVAEVPDGFAGITHMGRPYTGDWLNPALIKPYADLLEAWRADLRGQVQALQAHAAALTAACDAEAAKG